MAPTGMTLSDAEGHFSCLKPVSVSYFETIWHVYLGYVYTRIRKDKYMIWTDVHAVLW